MEIKRFLVWKQSVLQSKCKANGGYSEFLPQNKIRQSQTQKNEERGMWLSGRVSLAHTRSQIESLRTQLGRNSSMKISTMILLLSILIQCNQKSLPRKHFWYFLSCCLIWMICVVLRHSGGLELNYEAGLHDKKKNRQHDSELMPTSVMMKKRPVEREKWLWAGSGGSLL